jgi:hypothetical protein
MFEVKLTPGHKKNSPALHIALFKDGENIIESPFFMAPMKQAEKAEEFFYWLQMMGEMMHLKPGGYYTANRASYIVKLKGGFTEETMNPDQLEASWKSRPEYNVVLYPNEVKAAFQKFIDNFNSGWHCPPPQVTLTHWRNK